MSHAPCLRAWGKKSNAMSIYNRHISPVPKIALPTAQGFSFIALTDILYFKADNNEALVYYLKPYDTKTHSAVIFKRLSDIEAALHYNGFLRIRRNYLINTYNIKQVNNRAIVMANDETLYPSRDRGKVVEAYLKEHFYI